MYFRRFLAIILSILFLLFISPVAGYADNSITEAPDIKVIINGQNITFEDVVISSNGRTLLPLRALLTKLGVQNDDEHIIWNGSDKSVTIIKDLIKVKLIQGNNIAYINDIPTRLDVPPVAYSKNGRTYIPARFVAQSLGKIVEWVPAAKSVVINDPRQVTVGSADELVEAIDSNTTIILKKGVYNLSKVKQEYSENNVFWESVFDGNQLIIKGVKNLTIEGEGDTPAEIVVEPRYANVFSFMNSSNITIRNIKTGHTPEKGDCVGGVLAFNDSSNISIIKSELYGCGIQGLYLDNVNTLMFANSVIDDCNTAIMTLSNSKDISFYKSKFSDNQGYNYGIKAANNCSLFFEDCDFTNNQIVSGFFFSLDLSKIVVKNSRINNNSYSELASNADALTMENIKIEGNYNGTDIWDKATSFYSSGKYEDAIQCIDELITFVPDNYDAYSLKGDALYFLDRYDEAIECYDKVLAAPGKATAYLYYSKGAALYRLAKYAESITCYDIALALDPEYIDALNNKGDSLSNLGRYDEAVKCYEQVFALDTGNIEAMCGKGNIFFYQEKYEEAVKAYDELTKLNPFYITGYINKGVALNRLEKYEEALVCFDKIINELNPDYGDAYYYKAQSLTKLERFSDAVDNLRKAIVLFPANKEYIKNDTAFDSLRNRDDYKALIQ